MSFYIKDAATDELVRKLAKLRGKSLTETVRDAVARDYEGAVLRIPLRDRIKPIQRRIAAYGSTGLEADKAFYDSLNDE